MTNQYPYFEYFKQVIVEGRLAHGYALTGADDVMKQEISRFIIQTLACQENSLEPCLRCQMCQRIQNDQFADVIYVKPEGQSIKVEQIRQLKEWLSTSPVESNFKFAVIEQAETMNASASNALLTFLEEPIENVYLILYSSDFQKLLPTIQSRVQQVYISTDNQIEYEQDLVNRGIDPSHASILIEFPIEMMQDLANDYEYERIKGWIDSSHYLYRLLLMKDPMSFIVIQTQLKEYLSVQMALNTVEYLSLLNYSVLMKLLNKEDKIRIQRYFIEELSQQVPLIKEQLLQMNEVLLSCRQQIKANVAPQLAFETLVLQMLKD